MVKAQPAFLLWKVVSLLFQSPLNMQPETMQTIRHVVEKTHDRLGKSIRALYNHRKLAQEYVILTTKLDKYYHTIPGTFSSAIPTQHAEHAEWFSNVNKFLNNQHKDLQIPSDEWIFETVDTAEELLSSKSIYVERIIQSLSLPEE